MNKDKDKRPTIFDVARIPCIKAKIEEFIKLHDCGDEVISFFDTDPIRTKPLGKPGVRNDLQYLDNLDDWAETMHSDLPIEDYPNGWFGTHLKCIKGEQIFNWIIEHAVDDRTKAANIC